MLTQSDCHTQNGGEMSSQAGRNDRGGWPWPQLHDRNPHWLLDQLPHTLQAPLRCDLAPDSDRDGWLVTLVLAIADQAVLEALQPSAYELCAAAQHALGMASLGSQIDRVGGSISVRFEGASVLTFAGAPALWWIANAQAPALRAWIDSVLVQIRAGAPSAIQTEPDITSDNG